MDRNKNDQEKVPVKIKHNLVVLVSPEKMVNPEYIEKLKKKYEKCTGDVGKNFF